MERKNDIPFEHQMMFVLRRYDSVMAENIELRKEIEELTEALEELGGNNERKSLKKRIKKLSEKNESLKQKLSEKNNQNYSFHACIFLLFYNFTLQFHTTNLLKIRWQKYTENLATQLHSNLQTDFCNQVANL